MSNTKLRGIYAMLVTPFNRTNEDIDYEALRAEVDWCVEHGVDGVVATPSIGEFACMTNTERWKCFEVVADQASKHQNLTTLATIAAPYTKEVVEHARVCKELKFAGAQLIPPYYWIPDEDEVYRHYQLALETGLPVVVYHNPMLSKFFMTREFLGKLAKLDGVIGIKEVKTDRQRELEPLFQEVAGNAPVFTTFRVFTTGLILGSAGGFINAFAVPACTKLWKMWNNNGQKSDAKMEEIQNMINVVFPRGGEENQRHIGTTKLSTSVVSGIDMGPPRAPYLSPGEKEEKRIAAAWDKLRSMLN